MLCSKDLQSCKVPSLGYKRLGKREVMHSEATGLMDPYSHERKVCAIAENATVRSLTINNLGEANGRVVNFGDNANYRADLAQE